MAVCGVVELWWTCSECVADVWFMCVGVVLAMRCVACVLLRNAWCVIDVWLVCGKCVVGLCLMCG